MSEYNESMNDNIPVIAISLTGERYKSWTANYMLLIMFSDKDRHVLSQIDLKFILFPLIAFNPVPSIVQCVLSPGTPPPESQSPSRIHASQILW